MNNNHHTNNQRNHKESDVDLSSEPDLHTTASTTTPPTLPGSSAVSTNLNQLGQYLDEDLGDMRDGIWNRDYIMGGILPKEQRRFRIEGEIGKCDPITRSILKFCAHNNFKKQPSTLGETMQFYGTTSSVPQAQVKAVKDPAAAAAAEESPEVRRKREETELEEEQKRKKRRIASAHKLLRIGGSVHGPIEIDADDPPYEAERRIKGEMVDQYLDEDLGDMRNGIWNRDFIKDGILPKEQRQFRIDGKIGECDPITRSILKFCAHNGYQNQPKTLGETMQFYGKTPRILHAAEKRRYTFI